MGCDNWRIWGTIGFHDKKRWDVGLTPKDFSAIALKKRLAFIVPIPLVRFSVRCLYVANLNKNYGEVVSFFWSDFFTHAGGTRLFQTCYLSNYPQQTALFLFIRFRGAYWQILYLIYGFFCGPGVLNVFTYIIST